jgi:chromosome segregation ATPase
MLAQEQEKTKTANREESDDNESQSALIQSLTREIDTLKGARDRFRGQVLDHKAEIKSLKQQLHTYESNLATEPVISESDAHLRGDLKLNLTLSN